MTKHALVSKARITATKTRLLVSVRSAEEAGVALVGGADVVDVKEPRKGSLGIAEPEVWRAVAAVVDSQALTSVALGELLYDPIEDFAGEIADFAFAKIGLAGCGRVIRWRDRWRQVTRALPTTTRVVPVAYADWQAAESLPIDEVLELAATESGKLMLIDTFDKNNGRLTDHLSFDSLADVVEMAKKRSVQLALAGSLRVEDIGPLLALPVAYVGVRGAACCGGRDGTIDLACVKSLAEIVHSETINGGSCCLTRGGARQILPSR